MDRILDKHDVRTPLVIAHSIILSGHVQGVGFRPFVYRLANQCQIVGWIENRMGQVAIHVESTAEKLDFFERKLISDSPTHATPSITSKNTVPSKYYDEFTIRESNPQSLVAIAITPDLPVCQECIAEMTDSNNRRYQYPFINCTACGPRYTLIQKMPYDRVNTTMASFELCKACQLEYDNPLDRRFHAEPIACANCGPQLRFRQNDTEINNTTLAIEACCNALKQGLIVCIKGIGGYHLMCDACNDEAVLNLRQRKPRPHKPLAVMMMQHQLSYYVETEAITDRLLSDTAHPITLLRKKPNTPLAEQIAPGLNEVGVMLPYTPLHHLLLQKFAGPVVATSANISGEPMLTTEHDTEVRLGHVCDAYLHHDREIQRPADDPVFKIIANKPRPLRLGRGNTPLELQLPFSLDAPVLATGGQMKNTIALAWDNRVVISPHIGDLNSLRGQQVFSQTIEDTQSLYQVKAERVLCDAHPGYSSHRWARQAGLVTHSIYHHHAHAAVLAGEFPQEKRWLVFTWDGVGMGSDNTLWGGEALLGSPGQWLRVASIQAFHPPGGELASRQTWRSAAALCWQANINWTFSGPNFNMVYAAWQKHLNSPQTTAIGRLFDGAAALTNIIHQTSFEGQGPMLLEAAALQGNATAINLPMHKDPAGIWRSDWSPLLPQLLNKKKTVADRARCFHETLAQLVLQQAKKIQAEYGDFAVGLCGGVFQNALLTERVITLLQEHSVRVYVPQQIPVNDAGLCYGQIVEHFGLTKNQASPL